MAAAVVTASSTATAAAIKRPLRPKLACFSFAAYAKTVIDHLQSLQIPVLPGLTESEFAAVESTFRFSFPPDLRSILQEGLPIGPGFPNWRSSSIQQLHILINLPKFSLLKEISQSRFWFRSWGTRPVDPNDAVSIAKKFLDGVPVLVPIYKNCYIPSVPNVAGSPVFVADGGEIRVFSFDLAGFFQTREYSHPGLLDPTRSVIDSPAWAATEARAVEFWTEVASGGNSADCGVTEGNAAARGVTEGWWNEGEIEMGLDGCLENVFWKLREGGWREEDVKEMMMMNGNGDRRSEQNAPAEEKLNVSVGEILLNGGWSRDDVVYSLNLDGQDSANVVAEEESTFEINLHYQPIRIPQVTRKKKHKNTTNQLEMKPFFFAPHRNLIL